MKKLLMLMLAVAGLSVCAADEQTTYTLTIGHIPFAETDSVTLSPEPVDGVYASGTTVTLTANGDTFARWFGDVLEEDIANRTITVTMDGDKSIIPYFKHAWKLEGDYLKDGYWNVPVTASDLDLTLKTYAHRFATGFTSKNPFPLLDLNKPIEGGYKIRSIPNDAFRRHSTTDLYSAYIQHLTLPETLISLGKCIVDQTNLVTIAPFFPRRIESLTLYFITRGLISGVGKTTTVDLLSAHLRKVPTCLLSTKFGFSFDTLRIGSNVTNLGYMVVYCNHEDKNAQYAPRCTFEFYGDKPKTTSPYITSYVTQPIRIKIPKGNATWNLSFKELTDTQKTDFTTRYSDGNVDTARYVSSWGGVQCYVEEMDFNDMSLLFVEGDSVLGAPDDIDYGIQDWAPGASVTMTAPKYDMVGGEKYYCKGYKLYRSTADGWALQEESSSCTVTVTQGDTGSTKLVWKWSVNPPGFMVIIR